MDDLHRSLSDGLGSPYAEPPSLDDLRRRTAARYRRRAVLASGASAVLVVAAVSVFLIIRAGRPPTTTLNVVAPPSRVASLPSSATPSLAAVLQPTAIAFWDDQRGLLVGTLTSPSCGETCPGVIERTTDGGRTWQVVHRHLLPLLEVALAGGNVAWVTAMQCGPAPETCQPSRILESEDGGTTWSGVSTPSKLSSVSLLSATSAWAIAPPVMLGAPVHTVDGGRTWRQGGDPCPSAGNFTAAAVSFAGQSKGWLVCTFLPMTSFEPKAILSTVDGGVTWRLDSRCANIPSVPEPNVGTLSCTGYNPQVRFLADGHGWMWTDRGDLEATSDGGRTWSASISRGIVEPDNGTVRSASLITPKVGVVLVRDPDGALRLRRTSDGGSGWQVLQTWASR